MTCPAIHPAAIKKSRSSYAIIAIGHLDHEWQIFRLMVKVGVHYYEDIAPGFFKAAAYRIGQSWFLFAEHGLYVWALQIGDQSEGPVGTVIVHDDDFMVAFFQFLMDGLDELQDAAFFIIGGQDYGNFISLSHFIYLPGK